MGAGKSIEEKVLEYWFTLEFLGQEKYPQETLRKFENNTRALKKKLREGKTGYQSVYTAKRINGRTDLYNLICREVEACRMKCWGNLTVYIGKVRREACIETIAKSLPFDKEADNRPERNQDFIACASLQLTPAGKYIEHSLSLSPIVWAMKQIKECRGRFSDSLEAEVYREEINSLENRFFEEWSIERAGDLDEEEEKEGIAPKQTDVGFSQKMQEFDIHAVDARVFEAIFHYIEKEYLRECAAQTEEGCPYELAVDIQFQMFANEAVRDREEDDNYLGLSHDYFSNDLKMLLELVRGKRGEVPGFVLEYIRSIYEAVLGSKEKERIDLIRPLDRNRFEAQIQEILNVANAPLGKWPSKFMPAFMQQTAINLATKNGKSELFEKIGEIFSVNGPPGTGKTTLLKEIIVNNIVERARLLAKYENPDDAFEAHSFLRGTKANHAYSQYTQHWYSLKDDRIHDYSILVASCNNGAVENISKELPLAEGILKGLEPEVNDPKERKEALKEVSRLFDCGESSDIEQYERKSIESPDIYFTYYAKKLLNEEETWGLIAASLGKRKNIRDFYRNVLKPLRWDFYPVRDSAKNRLPRYSKARKNFLVQLEKVQEIQARLSEICELASDEIRLKKEILKKEERYRRNCGEAEKEKQDKTRQIEELKTRLAVGIQEGKELAGKKEKLEEEKSRLILEKAEREKEISSLRQEAFQVIHSVGRKPLFFGRAVYEEKFRYAKQAAEDYSRRAQEQEKRNLETVSEIEALEKKAEEMASRLGEVQEALVSLDSEMKALNVQMGEIETRLEKNRLSCEVLKKELKKTEEEYEVLSAGIGKGQELNSEFVTSLLSEDAVASTEAQVGNPWFTEQYNREREKLFFYAMKMNKEFLISSKKCRDNFTSLAHYWGLLEGDENERIVFHAQDRERCVGALYQTLFLLVPVISTTFASVGNFLKDVKDRGAIGTLIIDEAGQAQPQMAVGALYRCRKAVVVGDPKQVEPVVTDDLKLLKYAFDEEALKPYIFSKSLSVQSCADEMNPFGAWLENPEHPDYSDWVGCPLVVHRRCISPMYEIANTLSYNGIMKQKTNPPKEKVENQFIYEKSQWIQVKGKEKGNKNHFVPEQAVKVLEMLEIAFQKNPFPSVYIISPFTTVIKEIRDRIKRYRNEQGSSSLAKSQQFEEWLGKNIGTVHTFQGKEANEVLFLLGCDGSPGASGAVRWVNSNLVNVAVTRAKFRLYVIGDFTVWRENSNLYTAKNIMDTFAIKEIHSILSDQDMSEMEKGKALSKAARNLPSVGAFPVEEVQEENLDYSIETEGLVDSLEAYDFLKIPFTAEQLRKFGFSDLEEIAGRNVRIRKNLELGMRLYYFLQPVYEKRKDFDASCCAILFCKAMELQIKECFQDSIEQVLRDKELKKTGKESETKRLTLGAFCYKIEKNKETLALCMKKRKEAQYDVTWWGAFGKKLADCRDKRNQCCHDGLFQWEDLLQLLDLMFRESGSAPRLAGLLFESEVGKRLVGGKS